MFRPFGFGRSLHVCPQTLGGWFVCAPSSMWCKFLVLSQLFWLSRLLFGFGAAVFCGSAPFWFFKILQSSRQGRAGFLGKGWRGMLRGGCVNLGRQSRRQGKAFVCDGFGVYEALARWYFRMYFPCAGSRRHLLVRGQPWFTSRLYLYVARCSLSPSLCLVNYLLVSSSAIFFILSWGRFFTLFLPVS